MKIYNITLLTDESDLALKELPIKFVYKDSKAFGGLALFLGGCFVIIPLVFLAKTVIAGDSLKAAAGLLVISVIFFPLFLLGLNLIKRKRELIISNESISRVYSSLFKKEEWEEPISQYQGILLRTDVHVTGERNSSLVYALDLLHQDQTKTIRLFKSMEYNISFNKWKDYCQLFDCPALERVGKEEIILRDCKVLGKALVDMVKDGDITLFESPPPVPAEVEIKAETKGNTITLPDNTEIVMAKGAFTIKLKTSWKNEHTYEYSAVRTVLIDYSKSYKKWAWAVVIIERSSTHRSVYAHDLPYHILEWLQYYLLSEIIKHLN